MNWREKYGYIGQFSDGLALVRKMGGSLFGFVDEQGVEVIPCRFRCAGSFSEGLAPVQQDLLWGYIDKNGEWVIQPSFGYAWSFSDGLAAVYVRGLIGFINKKGELAIQPKYDRFFSFENGIAIVEKNNVVLYLSCFGGEFSTQEEARRFVDGLRQTNAEVDIQKKFFR